MAKRFEYDAYVKDMLARYEAGARKIEGEMEKPLKTTASEESLILASKWGDPWNPLWSDAEYGKKTKWGSILALPCYTDRVDYFSYWPSVDPAAGFVDHHHYGETWTDLKPIRPGDSFKVYQHAPRLIPLEPIEGEDGPPTFGNICIDADVYNQNGEIVSRHQRLQDIIVRPGSRRAMPGWPFEDHCYTPEQLAYIDDIIRGEVIRGAQTRYWEDVQVGDRLTPVSIGPTTTMDMVAYFASQERMPVAPMRVYREREGFDGRMLDVDPLTNVSHSSTEKHIHTLGGNLIGAPRGFHQADSARVQLARLVTNWMGDDGELTALDYRHINTTSIGDCSVGRGVVIGKYCENGQCFVVIDTWLENMCRGNVSEIANIIVKLPARESHEDSSKPSFGKRDLAVGEKIRVGPHADWWPGGNPLDGATGEVIRMFAWDEAYKDFPEYIGVRLDPKSVKTKLSIGNEFMLRREVLSPLCHGSSAAAEGLSAAGKEAEVQNIWHEHLSPTNH